MTAYAGKTPPPNRPPLGVEGGEIVQVAPELKKATGMVEVVVRLTEPSLAEASGKNIKWRGAKINGNQQRSLKASIDQKQNDLAAQLKALGGVEVGRVTKALNAIIIQIDAAKIAAVSKLPGVKSVRPVGKYEKSLTETVQYITANQVHDLGYKGEGVTVAVLDSGIDYTHRNLGGAGTAEAYEAAYGTAITDPKNTTLDGLFPTAKVVGGFDFVGELWPTFGARSEDPDPIDLQGHGTHVADIIGGIVGVAPEVSLYAVKVCSAVATSCNGIALLKAIDFSLDPNGDNDISDHVDVVNLSLGSSYGQQEDDLSFALGNAAQLGVIVVASAGNSADRPYILGSPSSQPEVISVAQTAVPSAKTFPLVLNIDGAEVVIRNTNTVPWAPVGSGFSGAVAYVGRGCPGTAELPGASLPTADPYLANPAGKVALIDRGACAVSEKVDRAAKAGAIAVLVANNTAGDPPSFSQGAGDTFVPTMILTQADGNAIKTALAAGKAVNATVSDAVSIPLVGSIVASSSRGPSYSNQAVKPDIGAPGASVSAVAGSGTGEEAFGGTSGAAPMVSGVAALLRQKYPTLLPVEIKALMVNTAYRDVLANPATQPGVLAPITRIGGGEVRAKRAATANTAAWDDASETPSLSFGYHSVSQPILLTRWVRIRNYLPINRLYNIEPTFRYANDEASGAVKVIAPPNVRVRANSSRTVKIQLQIDPSKLPSWPFTYAGGSQGGNGALLNVAEFDGYLRIYDTQSDIAVPWQVLPHKSAALNADKKVMLSEGAGSFAISNSGAEVGNVDIFALTGRSTKVPNADLPLPGDNFAVVDMRYVGARAYAIPTSSGPLPVMEFAINTWRPRSHPAYPAEFDVYIDSNNDGTFDYVAFTAELPLGSFAATGQTVVYVQRLGTTTASAFFFADTDLNTGNVIMTMPFASIGITDSRTISFSVYAFDNYFTGFLTDAIEGMQYNPFLPKYDTDDIFPVVPVGGSTTVQVVSVPGGAAASPSQKGLLLMYRDSKIGREVQVVSVSP
jgi:subtilisin family serine protease